MPPHAPKTPHEEIMFCIESTNAIVSKILTMLEIDDQIVWNNGYDKGYIAGRKVKE